MGCASSKPESRLGDEIGPKSKAGSVSRSAKYKPGSPQSVNKTAQIRDNDDEAKRLGRRSSVRRSAVTALALAPTREQKLKTRAEKRARPKTRDEVLHLKHATAECVLFTGLQGEDTLSKVFHVMTEETIEAGDVVIRQGDLGDE